ncbi:MAG: hypothetical protein IIC70_02180 [Acidobacteria bacterium]|nr:hypothetical protein [Acidobacteriota bacterium]
MRKATIGLALLAVLLIAIPAMAQTETDTIEILVDGIARGDEGEVIHLLTVTVPEGMVGRACTGSAESQNNESQHIDNDFILSSGATTAEIPNWEAVPLATTAMSGTLVLGPTVNVDLRLGPSEVSSGGVLIILSCAPPAPPETTTTTAPPPPTTGPPPPTTTPTTTPTDTTEPPPEGGVSAGGGSTAGRSGEAAMLWLGGGALALLGGATVLAMRGTAGRE